MRSWKETMRSLGPRLGPVLSVLVLTLVAGCGEAAQEGGGEAEQAPASGAAPEPTGPPSVTIVAPVENEEIDTDSVRVVLSASGIRIEPATVRDPGTGHHHLFIDTALSAPDDTIPQGVTGIIHLGRAQTEFTIGGLVPGTHRIIAVVADADHIPVQPLIVDTVRFVLVSR